MITAIAISLRYRALLLLKLTINARVSSMIKRNIIIRSKLLTDYIIKTPVSYGSAFYIIDDDCEDV